MTDHAPVAQNNNPDRSHQQSGAASGPAGKLNPQQVIEKAFQSSLAVSLLPSKEVFQTKFFQEQATNLIKDSGGKLLEMGLKGAARSGVNPIAWLFKLVTGR